MNYAIEQLPSRIAKKVMPLPESGCWLWMGCVSTNGYGRVGKEGRTVAVHRAVYEEAVGPIPDGLTIDHLCRVKCCVNPYHLEAVSLRDNILRSDGGSAQNARKTACRHGHTYTKENTYYSPNERERKCVTCRRLETIARTKRRNSPHLKPCPKQCGVCAGFLPNSCWKSGDDFRCPKCHSDFEGWKKHALAGDSGEEG